MKVLVIAHKPPFPRIDGGCIATAQLILGLEREKINYNLALIHTKKHPFSQSAFPEKIQKKIVLTTAIKTDGLLANMKALRNANHSVFTARFFDAGFANQLLQYCEKAQPDIIHFESLFAAVYFNTLKEKIKAKFILRTHNIEHQLWQERASTSNFFKRLALQKQTSKLKKEELSVLHQVDGIAAIAKNELEFVAKNNISTPTIWLPSGIDPSTMNSTFENDFFHLGAMDWSPNRRAVQWFLNNVWSSYPEKKQNILHVAGKGLLEDDYAVIGVKNHGTVVNSERFMSENGIMVVPLFEGSGLRIKILEAGSLGVPIIATAKAVEGIGLISGTHYFECNTAESFTGAMLLLSNDVSLRRKIGEELRKFVQENFNQNDLNRKLIEFYRGI